VSDNQVRHWQRIGMALVIGLLLLAGGLLPPEQVTAVGVALRYPLDSTALLPFALFPNLDPLQCQQQLAFFMALPLLQDIAHD